MTKKRGDKSRNNPGTKKITRVLVDHLDKLNTLKLDQKYDAKKIKELYTLCKTEALLHYLVKYKDLEGIKVLIEKVHVDPNLRHATFTPLMVAAEYGYMPTFLYLLEKGGRLKDISMEGMSPFCYAVRHNRIEIVKFLVDGKLAQKFEFEVNLRDSEGITSLMIAAQRGFKEVIDQILKFKDIDVNAVDQQQGSALTHCANSSGKTKNEHIQIANTLIKNGANIYQKNCNGLTPLMLFAVNKQALGIQLLLQCHRERNKENPIEVVRQFVNEKSKEGLTALMSSAIAGDIRCAMILIKAGIDLNPMTIDHNNNSFTAITLAADQGRFDMVEFLANGIIEVAGQKDINFSVDLSICKKNGDTALSRLLIGAKKSREEGAFNTLAMNLKAMKVVIQKTENINDWVKRVQINRKRYHLTILALALQLGNRGIINLLLQKGADVTALVQPNMSVFKFAYLSKNKRIVFPILLKAKFNTICSQYDAAKYSSQAIQTLVDFLCNTLGLRTMKLSIDDSILIPTKTHAIRTLTDQTIYLTIEKITVLLQDDRDLSSDDILKIICKITDPDIEQVIETRTKVPESVDASLAVDTIDEHPDDFKEKAPKEKTRGVQAADIVQRKMEEFARKRALNPELDINTTIISNGSGIQTGKKIDTSKKHDRIVDEPLKTDDELQELVSEKRQYKPLSPSLIPATKGDMRLVSLESCEDEYRAEDEEIPDFELDTNHFDFFQPQVSVPLFETATLGGQTQVHQRIAVVDKLLEVRRILEFNAKSSQKGSQTLDKENTVFLIEGGLWGAFGLLMEELKKFHVNKIFSAELARVLRNFIFHEEGELQHICSDPNVSEMCQKLIQYLDAVRSSRSIKTSKPKSQSKSKLKADGKIETKEGMETLEVLLKEIDSQLFNEIINAAAKKAIKFEIPSLAVCREQIKQAEKELICYQRICRTHPAILDDVNARTTLIIGLGRTVARLGSYVSAMKQNYYRHYRLDGYVKYHQYIEIGNRYRHGDKEGSEPWRILIDDIVEELILGYLMEGPLSISDLSMSSDSSGPIPAKDSDSHASGPKALKSRSDEKAPVAPIIFSVHKSKITKTTLTPAVMSASPTETIKEPNAQKKPQEHSVVLALETGSAQSKDSDDPTKVRQESEKQTITV